MSPLAEAVYEILAGRANLRQSPITYSELIKVLPPLSSPHDAVTANDPRLFDALREVGVALRELGLPTVTALVVRAADRAPGDGYYHMFHPEAGNDPVRRRDAWERELKGVESTDYPSSSHQHSQAAQPERPGEFHGPRQLGTLRIADSSQEPSTVFTGSVCCPFCSRSFEISVSRNPNILTEKQPTFVIHQAKGSPASEPLGCLFIGSILSSPVMYYGSLKHCDHEQRISIFFNRALRDRSDHHLVILPSISKGVT
jgi:hypothetical protein